MLLTLVDILHKVACEMYGYSGADPEADIEEFMAGHAHDFNLGITDDVEESEIYYHRRYGAGETFYFSLHHYRQGRQLAAECHQFFTGQVPDVSRYTGELYPPDRALYLFIHVSHIDIQVTMLPQIPESIPGRWLPVGEGVH